MKFLVQVESAVNPKCKCAELLNVNMLLHEKKKKKKKTREKFPGAQQPLQLFITWVGGGAEDRRAVVVSQ